MLCLLWAGAPASASPLVQAHSTWISRSCLSVVHKVEWINPHSYLYLTCKDTTGKSNNWAFECGPGAAQADLSGRSRG